MPVVMTASEMNRIHKVFWEKQKILMDQRMQRPELVLVAMEFVAEEARRQLLMGYRRGFEEALADAETAAGVLSKVPVDRHDVKSILVETARKAGSAPKADALTKLIRELVAGRPDLTLKQLISALEDHKDAGIIHDIGDDYVWFTNNGKGMKKVPMSGLRGRLTRAKDEVRRKNRRN